MQNLHGLVTPLRRKNESLKISGRTHDELIDLIRMFMSASVGINFDLKKIDPSGYVPGRHTFFSHRSFSSASKQPPSVNVYHVSGPVGSAVGAPPADLGTIPEQSGELQTAITKTMDMPLRVALKVVQRRRDVPRLHHDGIGGDWC